MAKRGRPKKQKEEMQEVITDIQSEVGSVTINFKNWVLNGTGNFQELHELLAQLEGVK